MISAIFAISWVSQSPKRILFSSISSTLIPTSMTRAQGRIISAVTRCFLPVAEMIISAFFVWKERFFVRLWQMVTVAPAWSRRRARGFPTIVLFQIMTTLNQTKWLLLIQNSKFKIQSGGLFIILPPFCSLHFAFCT